MVVMTSNGLIPRLSAVSVVIVTGTEGPIATHVPVDDEVGVSKYPVSWVNVTDLHTVPKARLRRRRGRLSPSQLHEVERCLRSTLDL